MSNDFKYDRTIRGLKANAKKGNFQSALQLVEYYKVGKFVPKNEELSEKYKQLAYDIFIEQDLHIKSMSLNNYRAFKSIDFLEFDRNLNVIIGNNGAGKTSLLDALDLSLSWLSNGINKNGGNGSYLEDDDINLYNTPPVANVITDITFNKKIETKISLTKAKSGYEGNKNSVSNIKKISGFYKTSNSLNPNLNLPLLAYYNVMRSYDVNPKDIKSYENFAEFTDVDKFDAYQKSLNGKTDFNSFFKWFKSIEDLIKDYKSQKTVSTVLSELGLDEEFLSKLKIVDPEAYDKLQKKIELDIASKEPQNISEKSLKTALRHKEIINTVISNFMNSYSDIAVRTTPQLDLTIRKHGNEISVVKLSQGEKTLLALVLDIARRMILLNPSLENPLLGNGIILIDEFDLHLHPKWQKDLANNLKNSFPNCQFFLTTHSPLALSELSHEKVFILDEDTDNEITLIRPVQCFGLSISEIVDRLMTPSDLDQLGQSQSVLDKYDAIFDLIDDDTPESLSNAGNEIEALVKLLNGNTPQLIKAKVRLETALAWHEDD